MFFNKCLKYYSPGTASKTEYYRQTLLIKNIVDCASGLNLGYPRESIAMKQSYIQSLHKNTVKVIKNFPFTPRASDDIANTLYTGPQTAATVKLSERNSRHHSANANNSDEDEDNPNTFDSQDNSYDSDR